MCNRLRDLICSEGNGDKIATLKLEFQIARKDANYGKLPFFAGSEARYFMYVQGTQTNLQANAEK